MLRAMTTELVSRLQQHWECILFLMVWDLQKPGYLLVYNIFTKKERTPKKSPDTQAPFTTCFCRTRNQIPFLWAYPLSKLEISFRSKKRKKTHFFTHLPKELFTKLSKKTFATTQDRSFYFKCITLVWKGNTAEGLYKFFLLLFSISFVHASQNYKILVGDMQKAWFHIPKDLFPCAVYEPVDHPGKPGKHTLAHQCCNCWRAALLYQGFARYFLWEISTKPDKQPSLLLHHL